MLLFSLYHPRRRSAALGLILMGVWFAGVTLGLTAARFHGSSFGEWLLYAASVELSLRNACLVAVLPLFFSAIAVFFLHRLGAYLACAVRGLTIGFLMGCLTAAGGMRLCILLLFSSLGFCPVLLWYLWRRLELGMRAFCSDALRCLLAGVALAVVDAQMAAPLLAAALSF